MDTESKRCWKCAGELINANGVHMGVPFAHTTAYQLLDPKIPVRVLVCGKCYDHITVNPDTKVQRTGEETI